MRLLQLENERMRPSATCIIILNITDSEKPMSISTRTTALARIKTISLSGTLPGELWWTSMTQSCIRFLLLATRNLDQIVASGWLKNHTKSPTYRLFSSWRAWLKTQAVLGSTKPSSWQLTMEESLFQCTTGHPFWNRTSRESQISRSITNSDFQRTVQEWFSAKS